MAYQEIFKRFEKKYTLTQAQYTQLRAMIASHMVTDSYGNHTIQNIYYDSHQMDLIRQSIEKPLYKEKLRLRAYGDIHSDEAVYFEIKKKYNGVVYKRRVQMPYALAMVFGDGLISATDVANQLALDDNSPSLQILNEIEWLLQRHHLKRQVYIAYNREALYAKNDPEFRMTFDSQLQYRLSHLDFEPLRPGQDLNTALIPEPLWLMEVKSTQNLPLWFVQILSALQIYPGSFSKYGYCYQTHLAPKMIERLAQTRSPILRAYEHPSLALGGPIYA